MSSQSRSIAIALVVLFCAALHLPASSAIHYIAFGEEVACHDAYEGAAPKKVLAIGLDASGGADTITNEGLVQAWAVISILPHPSEANAQAGKKKADNEPTAKVPPSAASSLPAAQATAVAIEGGNGADLITNDGVAQAFAWILADQISITEAAKETEAVDASATGISGGTGGDTIVNNSVVATEATALVGTFDMQVTLGAGDDTAYGGVLASATGIDGGDGKDSVTSNGFITATATTSVDEFNVAISGTDKAGADVDVMVKAHSVGIALSEGTDSSTVNSGEILTSSTSQVDLKLDATVEGGTTRADFTASATTVGIEGSGGADTITNSGSIDGSAEATLSSRDEKFWGRFTIFDGAQTSKATAIGIDTGNSADSVTNTGTINVSATATADIGKLSVGFMESPQNINWDLSTDVGGDFVAMAHAAGISLGDAANTTTNTGSIEATARALNSSGEHSFSLLSVGTFDMPMLAHASAVGIDGGQNKDTFTNSGSITATSEAEVSWLKLQATGIDLPIFNKGSAGINALSSAVGMNGNTSNDELTNSGTITADATSTAKFESVSFSLLNLGVFDTSVDATAASAGLAGGHGDDILKNSGDISVSATADSYSSGAEVTLFDVAAITEGDSSTEAHAATAGLSGGDGIDEITNLGGGSVMATSNAYARNMDLSFAFKGTPRIDSSTTATADAVSIHTGVGDETVSNFGYLGATSHAEANNFAGQANMGAVPLMESVMGFLIEDYNKFHVLAQANSYGIESAEGDMTVDNDGEIDVTSYSFAGSEKVALELKLEQEGYIKNPFKKNDDSKKKKDSGDKIGFEDLGNYFSVGKGVYDLFAKPSSEEDGDTATDISVKATSAAVAVQGGSGELSTDNSGLINATAEASAFTLEGKLGLGFKFVKKKDEDNKTPSTFKEKYKALELPGIKDIDDIAITGLKLHNIYERISGSDASGGSDGTGEMDAMALAYAVGIDGGMEKLDAHNTGTIQTDSKAFANSVKGEFEFSFEFESGGDSGGGGGGGNTKTAVEATSSALVTADAQPVAQSDDDEFNTNFENTGEGAADDDVLADMGTQAHSYSAGIMSNLTAEQADEAQNDGFIISNAFSEATATTVDFKLEYGGDTGSTMDAEADASSGAFSGGIGIATGLGGDDVDNNGAIAVGAEAGVITTGLALAFDIAPDDEKPKGYGASHVLADAKSTAIAQAVGVDAGEGGDTLDNTGAVIVGSAGAALTTSVSVSTRDVAKIDVGTSFADTSTKVEAWSTGLEAGAGNDRLINHEAGSVISASAALANSTAASVQYQTDQEKGWGVMVGGAFAMSSTEATADSTALSGGAGNDQVTNYGEADSTAVAAANSLSASVNLQGETKGVGVGVAFGDTSTASSATATGLTAGAGDDTLTNASTGKADADATALAFGESGSVAVQNDGKGVTLQGALAKSDVDATADAAGVRGSDDDDLVTNAGEASGTAISAAGNIAAAVAVSGDVEGVSVKAAFADTSAEATSTARGVDGEEADKVVSTGDADANAQAYAAANSVSVAVGGDDKGVSLGGALAFSGATATADASAVEGGEGADTITNSGDSSTHALSGANSLGVSVGVTGDVQGVAAGAAFTDTSTTSTTSSVGQSGAQSDDTITNTSEGTLDVDGEALAFAESVAVQVTGDTKGVGLGASLAFSAVTADVDSFGQEGGEGDDTLKNSGEIKVNALGGGGILGVGITASGDVNGVGGGVAFTDTSTTITADAVGMDGGAGDDTLGNNFGGSIVATSEALASANSASVTLAGDTNGVALSGAAALSSTVAEADATGMLGGAGDAQLYNHGTVSVGAASAANSLSASVAVTGKVNGVGVGVTFSDTSTLATAEATAVDGSAQESVLNIGDLNADAAAMAFGEAVSVSVGGTANGVSLSGALSFSSTEADASATAVKGGYGTDELYNYTNSTTNALSVANSLGVSVGVSGNVNGIGAGVTFSDTSTLSGATAAGQVGGAGDDVLDNTLSGTLDSDSAALAFAESVSVDVAGNTNGIAASAALSFSAVEATAESTGQSGGAGDDDLTNDGNIDADSVSVSGVLGLSVDADGQVNGIGAGVAFSDTSATAASTTTAVEGGEGVDELTNSSTGTVDANAQSYAAATSASIKAGGQTNGVSLGGALSFSATTADADATGMLGGEGDEQLENMGEVNSQAIAGANSLSAAVSLSGQVNGVGVGVAFTDSSTLSEADAVGIDGMAQESVKSSGDVSADAQSYAFAESVSVDVQSQANGVAVGGALSFAATQADSEATGVEGGWGVDTLTNAGESKAHSLAVSNAFTASVKVTGNVNGIGAGATFADNSSSSISDAVAYSGGEGDDVLKNLEGGDLDVASEALSFGQTVSVTVTGNTNGVGVGAALGLSGVNAESTGVALSGGEGHDELTNSGEITVDSLGVGGILGVGVNVGGNVNGVGGGAAFIDTSVVSSATGVGLQGGEGSDTLTNEETGVIDAGAQSYGASNSLSAQAAIQTNGVTLGGALAFTGTEASAEAVGIEADAEDEVINHGHVGAQAITGANSLGASVQIAGQVNGLAVGGAFVDAQTSTQTRAVAIEGGESVTSGGTFSSEAMTFAFSESVGVGVTGQANGVALNGAFALSGVDANAEALGISGGEGSDEIGNSGLSTVDSLAVANSLGVSVGVAGQVNGVAVTVPFAEAETVTTSNASGISTGSGEDTIVNEAEASLQVGSETYAFAETATVAFGGQGNGVLVSGALALSGVEVDAEASGIEAGAANDTISNEGDLKVNALAGAGTLTASVDIDGQVNGVTAGVALTDTSVLTGLDATGVKGGSGEDLLLNQQGGSVTVGAESYAFANAGSLGFAAQVNGVRAGASLSKATTTVDGLAIGFDGGADNDELWNAGYLYADSYGLANSFAVSLDIAGQVNGVTVGASLADTATLVEGTSLGLFGGMGDDTIFNDVTGYAGANVDSISLAESVSLSATGWVNGVTGNASLTRSGAEALADSFAVEGGGGADTIINRGHADADASSLSNTVSASVAIQGLTLGVGVAGAVSDSSSDATSMATALSGGAGGDAILNETTGIADAKADSTVVATSVAATIQGVTVGVNASASLAFSGTEVDTSAAAIAGSEGDDVLVNLGQAGAEATSVTNSAAVSLDIDGAVGGGGVQFSLTDSSADSHSLASGLSGGAGNDLLYNDSEHTLNVDSTSVAAVEGVSATLSGTEAVGIGGSVSLTNSLSLAEAVGIDGGSGEDEVYNESAIDVYSSSDAVGVSASVDASAFTAGFSVGAAFAETEATSEARATGIAGGDDGDLVANRGAITSEAEASGVGVGVSFQTGGFPSGLTVGGALAKSGSIVVADATGIDGGAGDDEIYNYLPIKATAGATGVSAGIAIEVNILGAGKADASTSSNAYADGLEGGSGEDVIYNEALIDADANSSATSVGVSASISLGISGADASTTVGGEAAGISGGDDGDTILNTGELQVDSFAEATAVSVNLKFAGAAQTDGDTSAAAQATGIDGGVGENHIENSGEVNVTAEAETFGAGVTVTLGGYGAVEADTSSTAIATGLSGGADFDELINTGALNIKAKATTSAASVGVTLAGASPVSAGSIADARAVGIAGSGSNNFIASDVGLISVAATAAVDNTGVSVTLAGYSGTSSSSTGLATAIGIDGGSGMAVIESTSDIMASSEAEMTTGETSFTLAGAANAAGSVDAESRATGVYGAADDSKVTLSGRIDADAIADFNVSSGAITLFGASGAGANAGADSLGVGFDGGGGEDWLVVEADVDATATSSIVQNSTSFSLGGANSVAGELKATSAAYAVHGGAGDDVVQASGALDATATSTVNSSGDSVNIFGAASSAGTSGTDTYAAGIAGGAGEDCIFSDSTITAIATSTLTQSAGSFSLGGSSSAGGMLTAYSGAAGIEGGDDGDFIETTGSITAESSAQFTIQGDSVTIFGASGSPILSGSQTQAWGIAGGEGSDWINNGATLDVIATSQLDQNTTTFTFGGKTESGGSLVADSEAFGLSGGASADLLSNSAAVTVEAKSILNVSGGSTAIFGASNVATISGASTRAYGFEGGGGDDYMSNAGRLEVSSTSELTLDGSSYAFGGASEAKGTMVATTEAVGVDGGEGAEYLYNDAGIYVDALSTLISEASVETTFGGSTSGSVIDATTTATGVDMGDGGSTVINDARIDVYSETYSEADMVSYSFIGSAGADVGAEGFAAANGVLGGEGVDSILNAQVIKVEAFADILSSSDSSTDVFTKSTSGGKASGTVGALGIDTGDGEDVVLNDGKLFVDASSEIRVLNTSDSGLFAGDADTKSSSEVVLEAIGISTGGDADTVVNDDTIAVTADALAFSWAYGSGAHWTFDADGKAIADNTLTVDGVGIDAGEGHNEIANNGSLTVNALASNVFTIDVEIFVCDESGGQDPSNWNPESYEGEALPELPSDDHPEGKALFWSGDGAGTEDTALGHGTVYVATEDDTWEALAGNCTKQIETLGETPSYAFSNGNGLDGDGYSSSTSNTNATAYGIKAGDGDDVIVNSGAITVLAKPDMNNKAVSDGDAWGDAHGYANINAYATAYGIYAGGGFNYIENMEGGEIDVTAEIVGDTFAEASDGDICIWFFGWWCGGGGSAYGSATINATSYAAGVEAGDDGNIVFNSGLIEARAIISKTASYNDSNKAGLGTASAEAFGIKTGGGADLIINEGTIFTEEVVNNDSSNGIAISSGGGADTVLLGQGSSTTGDVSLGSGNDTLEVYGTVTLDGALKGDSGYDTLVLHDNGAIPAPHPSFNETTKLGAGTYSLPALPTMEKLELIGGELKLDSDYTFDPEGEFIVQLNGDGTCGKLEVSGNAIIDGDVTIVRGGGAFIDGSQYDILYSAELEGEFDDHVMPDTPILSFNASQNGDDYTAEVDVASFTTVAHSEAEHEIGVYLDGITGEAKGEMDEKLGEIQGLSMEELPGAFDSMNPEYYAERLEETKQNSEEHSSLLEQRLEELRQASAEGGVGVSSAPAFTLSTVEYADDAVRLGRMLSLNEPTPARSGVWGSYKGGLGFTTTGANFNGESFGSAMGYDARLGSNFVAGVATGFDKELTPDEYGVGHSGRREFRTSLYSSYHDESSYLDTRFTYGALRLGDSRTLTFGDSQSLAMSDHSGQSLDLGFEAGRSFSTGGAVMRPFVGANYSYIAEDGFAEDGAGSLGLVVYDHDTEVLESDLGVKMIKRFEGRSGLMDLELLFDWNYRYGIFDNSVNASFVGAQFDSFSVDPAESRGGGAILGASMTYLRDRLFKFSLGYRGEHRKDYDDYTALGALLYNF